MTKVRAAGSTLSFDDVWRFADAAGGWLTRAQGLELYGSAREVPSGQMIVEIGSHHGRSTVVLAAAKPSDVELLAVDPFEDPRWGGGPDAYDQFLATLTAAGLVDNVRTFRGLSEQAARSDLAVRVGMIFIDGAHDLASVRRDIDSWLPHLAPDARMLFHDAYSSPGVTAALLERFLGSSEFCYRRAVGTLVRIDCGRTRGVRRGLSTARMLARLGFLTRNLVVKVAIRRGWTRLHQALGQVRPEYPY